MSVVALTLPAPAVAAAPSSAPTTTVVVVGIDVSQAWVDVAVHPTGQRWRTPTDPGSFTALATDLHTLAP